MACSYFDFSHGASHSNEIVASWKVYCDDLTQKLCSLMTTLEGLESSEDVSLNAIYISTPGLDTWWTKHKEDDIKRKKAEEEARIRAEKEAEKAQKRAAESKKKKLQKQLQGIQKQLNQLG